MGEDLEPVPRADRRDGADMIAVVMREQHAAQTPPFAHQLIERGEQTLLLGRRRGTGVDDVDRVAADQKAVGRRRRRQRRVASAASTMPGVNRTGCSAPPA
jgi:hypothetical protein